MNLMISIPAREEVHIRERQPVSWEVPQGCQIEGAAEGLYILRNTTDRRQWVTLCWLACDGKGIVD